ncbi:MAG: helix-turn-helix transcriptional regulator [Oscillospiraceae bacterium]|nr:helix-turn-helix transcriptional regulator [Oscillospiraceae bacterium]
MDNAELGRRLKAARLSKKMTQSDVVGTFITRNMLSQIESGSATPSMKTLEYLAGVLEIPMERLLSDADEPAPHEPEGMKALSHAKALLNDREYEALLALPIPCEALRDEFTALQSMAHLQLAARLAEKRHPEQLQTAVMHARHAASLAGDGIYANPGRAAEANRLITELAQYLSSYYSTLAKEGLGQTP